VFPKIVGDISEIEVMARGSGIRELASLKKKFGGKNWRKMKGRAMVELPDGSLRTAEVHWYEAHGVGQKKLKIKRLLD
jgi:hypothetical protein